MTKDRALPDGWKLQHLKDAASKQENAFVDGPFGSNLKVSDYTNTGVRLIQLQNVAEGKFIDENKKYTSEMKAIELSRHIARPGDIVIAKMAEPVARACIVPNHEDKWIVVADCVKLTPNTNDYDVHFLVAMINSDLVRSQAIARSTGSTRKRIGLSEIKKLTFLAPPLEQQRKIAAILSSLDDAIEKTQAVIDQLKRVKRGLMQQLFTRGIPGWHSEFQQVGRWGSFPAYWKVRPLLNCAVIQTGIAKGKKYKNRETTEMPYIRVANVQDGYFDLSEIKTIKIAVEEIKRYSLQDGDVLLTEGGDADKLGRGHIWSGQIDPCLHQNHIFCVRVDKQMLDPTFFSYLTSSGFAKAYFLDHAKQTTNLASINSTQLKNFPCPVPSLDEQKQIVKMFELSDEHIETEKAKKSQLETLKKGLMQGLLSGRMGVG